MDKKFLNIIYPLLVLLLVSLHFVLGLAATEDIDSDDFDASQVLDYNSAHSYNFDIKFEVRGGDRECFYQNLKAGDILYLEFDVLSGAKSRSKDDLVIDMLVWKPGENEFLVKHLSKRQGVSDFNITEEGDYKICTDNSFDRYYPKMVNLYLFSYNMEKMSAFANNSKEVSNALEGAEEITTRLRIIIRDIRTSMMERTIISLDHFNNVRNNRSRVDYMSFFTIIIIIIAAICQVYFVRKLFDEPTRRFGR